jgi:hypothetical protein
MSNILATWICIDSDQIASYFPSTKGSSSDQETQNVYWRCLAVSMYTARFFNPAVRLVVFSNMNELPIVDGVDFKAIFRELNIQLYQTPFEYITPIGYYKEWRNQFFEFSIMKFIASHDDFKEDDNFCLIDSDCVITGNLEPMFCSIDQNGILCYDLYYPENQPINGNSRMDMKNIFQTLSGRVITKVPTYYAGEYLGARLHIVRKLMGSFGDTWDKLIELHRKQLPRLHEEAHVFSYLFYLNGYENNFANKFIKRLWTTTYRNVKVGDEELLIWHLPAEKIYGFKKMFFWIYCDKKESVDEVLLMQNIRKFFTVPYLPTKLKIFYSLKRIGKKLLKTR